jgi:hypothetical protein
MLIYDHTLAFALCGLKFVLALEIDFLRMSGHLLEAVRSVPQAL